MTAAATAELPTRDELVTAALDRLYYAAKGLERPLTVAQLHVVRGHIAAARAALLTPPVRPEEMS